MKYLILAAIIMTNVYEIACQCFPDRHNTSYADAWISCNKSVNPNPVHSTSHWIMYDLGYVYVLGQMHIWNCNIPEIQEAGVRRLAVDYSMDGVQWTTWGDTELESTDASGFYEGQEGPDFDGLEARYILLTVKEDLGADCACLSEIRIKTSGLSTSTDDPWIPGTALKLFPNPAQDKVIVTLHIQEAVEGTLEVSNLSGVIVHAQNVRTLPGLNDFTVPVNGLPPGLYVAVFSSLKEHVSEQFSVINE